MTPSGCCSPKGCGHLQAACRRRLGAAGLEECPLCLRGCESLLRNGAEGISQTLDFGLDIIDGVGRLHLKGDSLAREGLDENLHGDLERVSRYV